MVKEKLVLSPGDITVNLEDESEIFFTGNLPVLDESQFSSASDHDCQSSSKNSVLINTQSKKQTVQETSKK